MLTTKVQMVRECRKKTNKSSNERENLQIETDVAKLKILNQFKVNFVKKKTCKGIIRENML